ncbi:MAG: response regulator transcription factor [Bacteroidota bacterium]
MEKIKIILVEDHQIVRDGIKALLTDIPNIEIVGEVADHIELYEKLTHELPDVIIMDISLPGMSGIELTRQLGETHPSIKVLMLSMYTSEDFIFNSLKSGARGYLPKNTTRRELVEAIETISRGEEFFSDSISSIILKSYITKAKSTDQQAEKTEEKLTNREIEILKLFASSLSNQEIADKLFISVRTVESHKNHIMQKLELKSTVDLIKFAIRNKLVEI